MSAEKTSSLLAEMRMLLRPLTDPAQRRRTLEFIWTTFWPVMFARAVAVDVASFFGMDVAPLNARVAVAIGVGVLSLMYVWQSVLVERERAKVEQLRSELDALRESRNDAVVGAGFDACAEEAACVLSDGKGVARVER
jgi:hypothetical protein